jgi:hypothetical protein
LSTTARTALLTNARLQVDAILKTKALADAGQKLKFAQIEKIGRLDDSQRIVELLQQKLSAL